MHATFFATPDAFRAWLASNHETAAELWVGFYRKSTGKPTITLAEAQEEALCFGWIDRLMHGIDGESYRLRFTPRKPKSTWSQVNVARAKTLIAQGRMEPAGLRAFEARLGDQTGARSYEEPANPAFEPADEIEFRANAEAWEFFTRQAPSYRRAMMRWLTSAKREETRQRRLRALIADSGCGRLIGPLGRPDTPR